MLRVIWLQCYLSWSLFGGGEKQMEGRLLGTVRKFLKYNI